MSDEQLTEEVARVLEEMGTQRREVDEHLNRSRQKSVAHRFLARKAHNLRVYEYLVLEAYREWNRGAQEKSEVVRLLEDWDHGYALTPREPTPFDPCIG